MAEEKAQLRDQPVVWILVLPSVRPVTLLSLLETPLPGLDNRNSTFLVACGGDYVQKAPRTLIGKLSKLKRKGS